jgi:hypothetical protein
VGIFHSLKDEHGCSCEPKFKGEEQTYRSGTSNYYVVSHWYFPACKNVFCHLRLIDEDVPLFAVGPNADENTTRKLPLIRPTKLLAKQVDFALLAQPSTPVARDVCRGQTSTLARFGIQP